MLKTLAEYQFIDVHYHANPDLYTRRHSALEAGKRYQKHHAAVVLTSHLGSTATQATLAQAEGYAVLPSLVLNDIAGGFDYRVIIRALLEYKPLIEARLLVHFPTITGRAYQSKLARTFSNERYISASQKPLTLFNDSFQLKPEVIDLIKTAADEPIVFSTGHACKEETYALIEEMGKYKNCKLMLNQPANPLTGLDAQALLEISRESHVFIEQTALTYLLGYQNKEDFKQVLATVPQVIYSSDLGQTSQLDVDDYIQNSLEYFTLFKLSEERKELIWQKNPAALLGF